MPDALIEANRAREAGEAAVECSYGDVLRQSVIDIVRRQRDLGIDVPGDGELGKATTQRINYGPWWRYSFLRMSGLAPGVILCRRVGIA
jgi:5-methyltetrahydropteroyltriglutamate--homocysteine methyltransferase